MKRKFFIILILIMFFLTGFTSADQVKNSPKNNLNSSNNGENVAITITVDYITNKPSNAREYGIEPHLEEYDPIDGLLSADEKPEWAYKISVTHNGGIPEHDDGESIVRTNDGDYTWIVNASHTFTNYVPSTYTNKYVDIHIELWDNDDLIGNHSTLDLNDDRADLNYNHGGEDIRVFRISYNFVDNKIYDIGSIINGNTPIDKEEDYNSEGDGWYVCHGELDGSNIPNEGTDGSKEDDAEIRFKIEDDYEIMNVTLEDDIEHEQNLVIPGTSVTFSGTVSGGRPPFTYTLYPYGVAGPAVPPPDGHDPNSRSIIFDAYTYTGSLYPNGRYMPALHIIDKYFDICLGEVDIVVDNPPYKPNKPNGPTNRKAGELYTYSVTPKNPADPDGYADYVDYLFDWGDGTDSGWQTGTSASHAWNSQGTYDIRVKAKDIHDIESGWSDPLEVTMPKSKQIINTELADFLMKSMYHPMLYRIFQICEQFKPLK